jgi:hypothetical protein
MNRFLLLSLLATTAAWILIRTGKPQARSFQRRKLQPDYSKRGQTIIRVPNRPDAYACPGRRQGDEQNHPDCRGGDDSLIWRPRAKVDLKKHSYGMRDSVMEVQMTEYTTHMGQGRLQSGTAAGSERSSVDPLH